MCAHTVCIVPWNGTDLCSTVPLLWRQTDDFVASLGLSVSFFYFGVWKKTWSIDQTVKNLDTWKASGQKRTSSLCLRSKKCLPEKPENRPAFTIVFLSKKHLLALALLGTMPNKSSDIQQVKSIKKLAWKTWNGAVMGYYRDFDTFQNKPALFWGSWTLSTNCD